MSVDGDAAVKARIRIGWNELQFVPVLTNKDISLREEGCTVAVC